MERFEDLSKNCLSNILLKYKWVIPIHQDYHQSKYFSYALKVHKICLLEILTSIELFSLSPPHLLIKTRSYFMIIIIIQHNFSDSQLLKVLFSFFSLFFLSSSTKYLSLSPNTWSWYYKTQLFSQLHSYVDLLHSTSLIIKNSVWYHIRIKIYWIITIAKISCECISHVAHVESSTVGEFQQIILLFIFYQLFLLLACLSDW